MYLGRNRIISRNEFEVTQIINRIIFGVNRIINRNVLWKGKFRKTRTRFCSKASYRLSYSNNFWLWLLPFRWLMQYFKKFFSSSLEFCFCIKNSHHLLEKMKWIIFIDPLMKLLTIVAFLNWFMWYNEHVFLCVCF